jgi:hypothetical protein
VKQNIIKRVRDSVMVNFENWLTTKGTKIHEGRT